MITHGDIAKARGLVERAQKNLAIGMLAACPLPHKFVQHRDGRLPWCEACGYDVTGERVKVTPPPT